MDGVPAAGGDEETRVGLRLPQPGARLVLKLYRAADGSILPLAVAGQQEADLLVLTDP